MESTSETGSQAGAAAWADVPKLAEDSFAERALKAMKGINDAYGGAHQYIYAVLKVTATNK